jgi:hypothetical protein
LRKGIEKRTSGCIHEEVREEEEKSRKEGALL